MIAENKLVAIIALSRLKGIGPAFVKKTAHALTFETANLYQKIKEITEINKKFFDELSINIAIEEAYQIIRNCIDDGIEIIDLTHINYPILLKEIKDPPAVIYCKGKIDLLKNKTVCVIGTREPNENGVKISERIGAYYSNANWSICNGLAEGVDNFSIKLKDQTHKNVIGIVAGGLNFEVKKTLLNNTAQNANNILLNDGVLISEMPPDFKEDTFSVVKSCRIQAGISKGLILVQSSLNGGSRHTIKAFCETQRPIGVINPVQSDINSPSYEANKQIVLFGKKGLSKFTDLKDDKILTSKIFVIKSREDYSEFEQIMIDGSIGNDQFISTLF